MYLSICFFVYLLKDQGKEDDCPIVLGLNIVAKTLAPGTKIANRKPSNDMAPPKRVINPPPAMAPPPPHQVAVPNQGNMAPPPSVYVRGSSKAVASSDCSVASAGLASTSTNNSSTTGAVGKLRTTEDNNPDFYEGIKMVTAYAPMLKDKVKKEVFQHQKQVANEAELRQCGPGTLGDFVMDLLHVKQCHRQGFWYGAHTMVYNLLTVTRQQLNTKLKAVYMSTFFALVKPIFLTLLVLTMMSPSPSFDFQNAKVTLTWKWTFPRSLPLGGKIQPCTLGLWTTTWVVLVSVGLETVQV